MRHWPQLKSFLDRRVLSGRGVVLGLDFDGTLSPLVRRPASASLPAPTRRLLRRLIRKPRLRLAIVSGRSLADIKARARLEGAIYCGNHGLEIEEQSGLWTHPGAKTAAPALADLARGLSRRLTAFPKTFLEDKGLTLTVHCRGSDPKRKTALRRVLARALKPYARLRLASGKNTFEVRPKAAWNKGHALLRIARGSGGEPVLIFVGDDRTDEEGFKTLGCRAVTVRVGPSSRSAAGFMLAGQRQVQAFLEALCGSLR